MRSKSYLVYNQAPYTTAIAHAPSHLTERATHAHPLHPAALASVPYGIVLVRVRVRSNLQFLLGMPERMAPTLREMDRLCFKVAGNAMGPPDIPNRCTKVKWASL